MSQHRSGLFAGVGAYALWGIFPLYWPLLEPAGAVEILAHRIVWSLVFLGVVLAFTSGLRWLHTVDRRRALLLLLASVLITINWGTFIYGVNADRVVECSLGYFMNPLVTVALAVVVLKERLRPRQQLGIAIGVLAVVVLAVDYGRPPWIAITLACSFALYGLVKKQVGLEGTYSLTVETAFLFVPAVAYLVWLGATGDGTFTTEGADHVALFVFGGVATAIPLMLFGAAAIRIPLSTLGLLQYLAPTLQFLIGVVVNGEAMPPGRLAGFALVWIALAVFASDALRSQAPMVPAPATP